MIKPELIPDEVVEALCNHVGPVMTRADWCAALAAALAAWPNARLDYWAHYDGALLLPLPNEGADE
jgi:hypothetical protein